MTVLVLSEDTDPAADRVIEELTRRDVPVFRCDTGWFPDRLSLDAWLDGGRWAGTLSTSTRAVNLVDLRSVYYRRPTAFTFPDTMSAPERRHAAWEAKFGLGGVLASLPVRWVNHPAREADACYKPIQLTTAQQCGLTTPETLITNDPDAVRRFADQLDGRIVVKTLGAAAVQEDGMVKAIHTHPLTESDLADLSGVTVTAHLFQERIDKSYEVRVTAAGPRLYAAAIDAASAAAQADWRADLSALSYRVIDVPPAVSDGIAEYLEAFQLGYGAFDFAVMPDGEWTFFECNPGGQYGWIETHTGLPITSGIADLLEKG